MTHNITHTCNSGLTLSRNGFKGLGSRNNIDQHLKADHMFSVIFTAPRLCTSVCGGHVTSTHHREVSDKEGQAGSQTSVSSGVRKQGAWILHLKLLVFQNTTINLKIMRRRFSKQFPNPFSNQASLLNGIIINTLIFIKQLLLNLLKYGG